VRSGGDEPFELQCRWLVNAAGLDAQRVARAMRGFPAAAVPRRHLAKGHYFALAAKAPFTRLVYPTPVDGGLGVHLTLDLGGQARFGPDVEWIADGAAWDYAVDVARRAAFEADIRRYWPGLTEGALQPAYTGVRPKLSGRGEPAADFAIHGPETHGVGGVVQLFGIESPGLTASLAIADEVLTRIRRASPGELQ
jgi:L-2-hydroxyglutarate oxidase LhgO